MREVFRVVQNNMLPPMLTSIGSGIELPREMDGDDTQSTSTNETSPVDMHSQIPPTDDPSARRNQLRRHTVGIAPAMDHRAHGPVPIPNMSPPSVPPQPQPSSFHHHSPSSPGTNVPPVTQRGNATSPAFAHGQQHFRGSLAQRNLSEYGMQRSNHPGTPLNPDPRNSMAQDHQSSTPAVRSGATSQQQRHANFDMNMDFLDISSSGKLSPLIPLIELCSS